MLIFVILTRVIKSVFLVVIIIFSGCITTKKTKSFCQNQFKGIYSYFDFEKKQVEVFVKGRYHKELHMNGKYSIYSELQWVDNCSFELIVIKNSVPYYIYQSGDTLNVIIRNIDGDTIHIETQFHGQTGSTKMIKKKKNR